MWKCCVRGGLVDLKGVVAVINSFFAVLVTALRRWHIAFCSTLYAICAEFLSKVFRILNVTVGTVLYSIDYVTYDDNTPPQKEMRGGSYGSNWSWLLIISSGLEKDR